MTDKCFFKVMRLLVLIIFICHICLSSMAVLRYGFDFVVVGIVVCSYSRQVCMHKEGDKFDHKTHILNGFNRLMVRLWLAEVKQ